MICVSIRTEDFQKISEALKNLDFAEIRLDLCWLSKKEIARIFSSGKDLIATCRPGPFREEERILLLKEAILSGARYVDIEIDSSFFLKEEILKVARDKACRVIISYHNDARTPGIEELKRIVQHCFREGADICKIACRSLSAKDMVTILSLYGEYEDFRGRIIALGIGKNASLTRIAAPFLGAPFTFASLEDSERTAEGQFNIREMQKIFSLLKKGEP
jgi:3-dehydroquinate dehydratase-1